MTIQTRERELIIEAEQKVFQTIDPCQEVREERPGTPTVQTSSGDQNPRQAIPDPSDWSLSSHRIRKALARFGKQLAAVYDMLVAPPATKRGHIRNAMVRAKHDRFISFLR